MTVGQLRAYLATVPPSTRVFVSIATDEADQLAAAATDVVALENADAAAVLVRRRPERAVMIVARAAGGPSPT